MQHSLAIFTGGSAFNPTAFALRQIGHHRVDYIIPTTDDGGSSAEILRYFGGPAIGDLRSRLLRLASESTSEARAIKYLLQHRLPGNDNAISRNEWCNILDGSHSRWTATISDEFKCTVLRFLHYFEQQVQDKHRQSSFLGSFDYRNGSIGNFFFTGARLFFGSLNAAIFWWSRVAGIPEGSRVIPAATRHSDHTLRSSINSLTIGAVVQNNDQTYDIVGQSAISHPSLIGNIVTNTSNAVSSSSSSSSTTSTTTTTISTNSKTNSIPTNAQGTKKLRIDTTSSTSSNTSTSPNTSNHNNCTSPRIMKSIKNSSGLIPFDVKNGKIIDLYHVARPINQRVVSPPGNPKAISALTVADVIVFGIGSLFTSILAGIIPKGNGRAVLENETALKILIVNSKQDRETFGLSVMDYIKIISNACMKDGTEEGMEKTWQISDCINTIVVLEKSEIEIDMEWLKKENINVITINGSSSLDEMVSVGSAPKYDPSILARCLLDTQANWSLNNNK